MDMKNLKRNLLAAAVTSMAVGLVPVTAMAATTNTVTVQPGDSLWKIANAHHVSLQSLEVSNPGVNPLNLQVGTTLQLPQSQSQKTYTVQPGDSLFLVARKFGITTPALQSANPSVNASNLQIGTVLNIPQGASAPSSTSSSSSSSSNTTAHSASSTDLYWMARIIYAEAGDQSYNAQVAVGDVVWHRMMSPQYPSTAQGVVFQISSGHYQFTPVQNGTIYNTPSAQAVQAAQDVLQKHVDLVPGAYVFYTPSKTPASSWVRQQPYVNTFDSMVFSV